MIVYETYQDFSKPIFESNAWGVVLVASLFFLMTYSVFFTMKRE